MSQEELAEEAAMSVSGISALERGERKRPYPATIRRLADALSLADEGRARLVAAARRTPAVSSDAIGDPSRARRSRSLFGRETELAQILPMLSPGSLVTIFGMGGVGKSRLASTAADRFEAGAPAEVHLVDLEPLASGELVAPTISAACGVREETGTLTLEALSRWIGSRRMLIVLDGCEEVLPEVGRVSGSLLERCPGLTLLATSQEPLKVPGENAYGLGPLDVEERGGLESATAIFLESARRSARGEQELDLPTIEAICKRLDGIPLAIELAAAWTRLMSPAAILQRLDDPLGFLVMESADTSNRRRTLRAALEHTYSLLEANEAMLFRRLAVFAGGFSIDAAEEICSRGVDQPLLALARLADLSLVQVLPDDRYKMLDPVLRFASEKLTGSNDQDTFQAHASYFTRLAAHADPVIRSPDQQAALTMVETDIDNVRSALRFMYTSGRIEDALGLVGSLASFWMRRGYAQEGLSWVHLITDAAQAPSDPLVKALYCGQWLTWQMGDHAAHRALAERCIEAADHTGDLLLKADAIHGLAMLDAAEKRGDVRDRLARAVEMAEEIGDPWFIALFLNDTAHVTQQGITPAPDIPTLEAALDQARRTRDPWLIGMILDSTARAHLARHDTATARAYWREVLVVTDIRRDPWTAIAMLEGLAEAALIDHDPEGCLRLLGLASHMRDRTAIRDVQWLQEHVRNLKSEAGSGLKPERAEAVWREGEASDLGRVLEALSVDPGTLTETLRRAQ